MPGPKSHGGWRRHVRIARNGADDAYGATIDAPSWLWIPLLGDGMKAKATAPRYVPETNYGGDYLRHVAIHHRIVIAGDLSTLLWPEVTQFLLDMALLRVADDSSPNCQDLYGHVVEHHTPDDPRRTYGLVVNSMRLACTGTGDGEVVLTHSCIGQREEQVTLETPDYSGITPVPFMFRDARIEIDSAVVTDVEQFTLTVENNIGDAPLVGVGGIGVRAHAIANLRVIGLELTKLNNSDRFNRAIREGNVVTFSARFTHPDGHLLQIILPELYVEESAEDGTPTKQATEAPKLFARAASSGIYRGRDIVYGCDLAAGGTTTLAEPTTTTAGG
jgi:hypothetical protein